MKVFRDLKWRGCHDILIGHRWPQRDERGADAAMTALDERERVVIKTASRTRIATLPVVLKNL
jgi:hypothetical protein